MKKFQVEVTKTWDFEVEIDETIWNEENIADWKKTFYDVSSLQEVIKIFATMFAEQGEGSFLEGFGVPMINNGIPFPQCLTAKGCGEVSKDISVNSLREDIEADVKEIE